MAHRFNHLSHVIDRMGLSERENAALVLNTSEQALLRALAAELIAANAIEAAAIADLDVRLTQQHVEEMAALSADLPAPPGPAE